MMNDHEFSHEEDIDEEVSAIRTTNEVQSEQHTCSRLDVVVCTSLQHKQRPIAQCCHMKHETFQ